MGSAVYEIRNPATEQLTAEVPYLSPEQATERLDRAEAAAKTARQTPLSERVALCRAFLDSFEKHLDEHARAITSMMGKPLSQAKGEFGGMKARTLTLCDLAPEALATQRVIRADGIERMIAHEPLGVVLDIAAWNYPLLVAINVVAPAILAGNSVLLKHAPQTALVGQQFERAFREAGAPDGLMQDFFVDHETAAEIIRSGRLGYVGFTGSVAGGKTVHALAGDQQLLRTGLELGGKDAAIVLEDADLKATVAGLVDGAFYNAGQSCCAVERIYVHHRLYEDFLESFAELSRAYVLGDPTASETSLGPVVNAAAAERVRRQVKQAVEQGARLLVGPSDFAVPEVGYFVPPHVLADAPQASAAMQEESFGPLIGIRSFQTTAEALSLANDSQFGLTASVWTQDPEAARKLGAELQVGTVFCNRADFVDPELPWSGVKDSGLGCTLSPLGLRAMTRPKSYHFKPKA